MSEEPARRAADGPRIDGRTRDDIEAELREMAPYYAEAWEPSEGDVGTTLLTLFSELAEEVTERLDRVPEKHRVSFFETLGFGRKPPQPARLPVSVSVADRAGRNVAVPAGTQAKATGTDGSDRLFEVPAGGAFDATPANLRAVYSLEPAADAVFGHDGTIDGGVEPTALFDPADGENRQDHVFYIGDAERLAVGNGSSILLELATDAEPGLVGEDLHWEYFGERQIGDDAVEGWHPFPSQVDVDELVADADTPEEAAALLAEHGYEQAQLSGRGSDRPVATAEDGVVTLTFEPDGTLTATEVDGIESKWVRCRIPSHASPATRRRLFDLTLEPGDRTAAYDPPVRVGARADGLAPDTLLRNDVPLEPSPIRPFGTWPRERDTFYLASTDAFTKPGASVTITFQPPRDFRPGELVVDRDQPDPDTAVVIKTVEETADEWVVYQDETVAYQNRMYDYDGDEAVVLVTFKEQLDDQWSDWPDADPTDLFQGVMAEGIKFHAFPAARLDRAASGPGADERHSPELSWEYFDGEGWSSLPGEGRPFSDGTDGLQRAGTVEVTVPEDLAPTAVAGHEGHWIRVRLVGGDYGELKTEPKPNADDPTHFEQIEAFDEPVFGRIRLGFRQDRPPNHAVAYNNLDFGADMIAERAESYRPFEPLPTEDQALYLGFDGPLRDGPINLLFDLADVAYPPSFHPRLRWEYYDVDVETWQRLDVRDGTEGLTERGIVSLVFPEATRSRRTLGAERHWVRARVTGESFGVDESTAETPPERRTEGTYGRFVETVPPAGEPGRHPPPVRGIYPNAGWVLNRRTVEAEVIGSSDGSIDQTFGVGTPPIVGAEVWVDELAVLSQGAREELRERWPDRTEPETDAAGDIQAFWVRWGRQPDLLDSGPDDRHYTLDPIDGTVTFGDGSRGKIPPRGSDNVRVTYETGGGEAGNVPAGAVSGFRQSLAFVESVTNPIAGAAGADAEATAAVTGRAARQLRDRNRAVAPADIERIAGEASRKVARTRCLPGMDQDGEYTPGWVTLLVVPDTTEGKPMPSTTLRETVEAALAERAPATLIAADQLVVRGPSYVSVSVDAELAATGGSISQLEERARGAVRSFLHPLTGGPTGTGWPFGELACRSDLFELLEGLDRVDHVERLTLQFETSRSRVTVAEGDDDPDTSADALGFAGEQEITATLVDDGGGAS